jgi:predicted nucleotidyltransferase
MSPKQEIALETIARWADRFECIKSVVIFGSVARGDEGPKSDLDVDLEFVAPLTGLQIAESYIKARRSFDDLHRDILGATGHPVEFSNDVLDHLDDIARMAIECGTEIGVLRKARIVATAPKQIDLFGAQRPSQNDVATAGGNDIARIC